MGWHQAEETRAGGQGWEGMEEAGRQAGQADSPVGCRAKGVAALSTERV